MASVTENFQPFALARQHHMAREKFICLQWFPLAVSRRKISNHIYCNILAAKGGKERQLFCKDLLCCYANCNQQAWTEAGQKFSFIVWNYCTSEEASLVFGQFTSCRILWCVAVLLSNIAIKRSAFTQGHVKLLIVERFSKVRRVCNLKFDYF